MLVCTNTLAWGRQTWCYITNVKTKNWSGTILWLINYHSARMLNSELFFCQGMHHTLHQVRVTTLFGVEVVTEWKRCCWIMAQLLFLVLLGYWVQLHPGWNMMLYARSRVGKYMKPFWNLIWRMSLMPLLLMCKTWPITERLPYNYVILL